MNSPEKIHPEHSPDKSARTAGAGGAATGGNAEIHDRTGLYVSLIALVIAAMALGISLMQPKIIEAQIESLRSDAQTAEREARVMQERWNDLKVELTRRGIPVSDH